MNINQTLISHIYIYIYNHAFAKMGKRWCEYLMCEWRDKELGLMKLTLGTRAGEDSTSGGLPRYGRLRLCGTAYWEIPASIV